MTTNSICPFLIYIINLGILLIISKRSVCMLTKDTLMQRFRKTPEKYWKVDLFKDKGFERRHCKCCGKFFWTLDPDRKICGDPPCENYGFISSPITKVRWDYVQTWKAFEKFFLRKGHASVPRYPVIDRWRPDLFFTIASIQDFQRLDKGNMTFEYPANPLVVPQVCLRFPDIQNVGVTGRHHTSFVMSGQHAFGFPDAGYFKDRCLELNFEFLNKVMGIPEKELTYVESLWAMPDLSAFGPSMETLSRGLELVNSVFMQFTRSGSSFKELPKKVIDVGWGHERLVWFTQGTLTGYDAVFGPVIERLKKQAGLKGSDLLERYSSLAASLDVDETSDIKKARQSIARRLGVSVKELNEVVEPSQALYAIADHSKTLLFALTDGGIPSNVGGGYNLRVLLRRMFSFLNEFGFNIDLARVAELHTNHLKLMFPELSSGLDNFSNIIEIERKRYEKTLEKAGVLIQKELETSRGRLGTETMRRLYVSNGITPELIEKVARELGLKVSLPEGFYSQLTDQHMSGQEGEEDALKVDVSKLPGTRTLFYEKPYQREFTAKVLARLGDWIVLDRTLFYAEGGGQLSDTGDIWAGTRRMRVMDAQRIEDVILHRVDKPAGIKQGLEVRGEIDWNRREILMKMHTCTHLVAGAARKVVGSHVWQAGAKKDLDMSRIDLTHYKPFTQEELLGIEELANDIVKKDMPVKSGFMPRGEAEKSYGFTLYQGGASPGKTVRVVNTANGFDVEACGGTHLKSTSEVGLVKIIRAERIQDGVNRLVFTCGQPAYDYLRDQETTAREIISQLSDTAFAGKAIQAISTEGDISSDVQAASAALSVEPRTLSRTFSRFLKEIDQDHEQLNSLRKSQGLRTHTLEEESFFMNHNRRPSSLSDLSHTIFAVWKDQKKALEVLSSQSAQSRASKLVAKAKSGRVLDIIPGERKVLIEVGNQILKINKDLTVILANQAGDVIAMSRTSDANQALKKILEKTGGSGGGRKEIAQGRLEISKLMKIINQA
jgi:alanyl-tRNA synthetase